MANAREKKFGCTARITVKEKISFPQFKVLFSYVSPWVQKHPWESKLLLEINARISQRMQMSTTDDDTMQTEIYYNGVKDIIAKKGLTSWGKDWSCWWPGLSLCFKARKASKDNFHWIYGNCKLIL